MADEVVDDYMADISLFLPAGENTKKQFTPQPVAGSSGRPSTGSKASWKQKRLEKKRQVEATEENLRQEGLKTAIGADNVGFRMLQKLGYKEGQSIGRNEASCINGRPSTVPVDIEIRKGRGGLGKGDATKEAQERERRQAAISQRLREAKLKNLEEDFRGSRRGQWELKKLRRDVYKARSLLAEMDGAGSVAEDVSVSIGNKITDSELFEEEEDVERIKKDLEEREQRKRLKLESSDHDGIAKPFLIENLGEEEAEDAFTEEILTDLIERLREKHNYCMFCGCKYSSTEDMVANCPGNLEELH